MSRPENREELLPEDPGFPVTHWSVVLAAAASEPERAARALGQLCRTYWYPLYAFIRRQGHSPEDAQDLTQEFFARLLQKRYLDAADPEKGRFRSFLLVAVKRFLANEWDRARRQKRGGGSTVLSLDEEDAEGRYLNEPADEGSPEKAFERRWALTLLHEVLERLEGELKAEGRSDQFLALKPFLTGESDRGSYAGLAAALGMTEGALQVAVHRLRQRYRQLLRSEIARTVARAEDIDEEIRQLFTALS